MQASADSQPPLNDHSVDLCGELLLCLGQAFLVPREEAFRATLRDDLCPDLEAINAELGFTDAAELGRLAAALATTSRAEGGFLRVYSRLFLSPPIVAPLNGGIYLDGALMGGSTRRMEAFYARHGLVRDSGFKDLPDHLSLQLQFVAWLHSRASEAGDPARAREILADARNFIRRFVLPWIPQLVSRLSVAGENDHTVDAYLQLARTVEAALQRDLEVLLVCAHDDEQKECADEPPVAEEVVAAATPEKPDAPHVHCRVCGSPFGLEPDLAFMIRQLEVRGLATDHLRTCRDCRAGEMGFGTMNPPTGRSDS